MKRESIDLWEVRAAHIAIHDRLCNWAKWCGGSGRSSSVHPMFVGYRPDGYHEVTVSVPVDSLDGHAVEKMVVALPVKNRTVLQWVYVRPYIPVRRVRQALGLTLAALQETIHESRSMLRSRE